MQIYKLNLHTKWEIFLYGLLNKKDVAKRLFCFLFLEIWQYVFFSRFEDFTYLINLEE